MAGKKASLDCRKLLNTPIVVTPESSVPNDQRESRGVGDVILEIM